MRPFLIAALLLAAPVSFAASFDCNKAASTEEKTICRNPQLGRLDEDLAASYHQALKQLSAPWDAKLRQTQREWLKTRVAKADPKTLDDALAKAMQMRIQQLKSAIRMENGVQLLQLQYTFALPVDKAALDPGGDWSQLSTVEQSLAPLYIINDVPGSKAFNQWVDQEFALPDAAARKGATAESSRTLSANFVSRDLLSLRDTEHFYGLGAARPLSRSPQHNYWLSKQRLLKTSDVFNDHDWQKVLLTRVLQYLIREEGLNDTADGAKNVADYVLDPSRWAITAKALTVVISQGNILPGPAGQVEIEIPWGAFLDMMNPEFRTVLARAKRQP